MQECQQFAWTARTSHLFCNWLWLEVIMLHGEIPDMPKRLIQFWRVLYVERRGNSNLKESVTHAQHTSRSAFLYDRRIARPEFKFPKLISDHISLSVGASSSAGNFTSITSKNISKMVIWSLLKKATKRILGAYSVFCPFELPPDLLVSCWAIAAS